MAVPESGKPESPAKKSAKPKLDEEEDKVAASLQSQQKLLSTGLSRAIVITALILGAVMLANGLLAKRFELIPAPNAQNSFMYRLDRLTGHLYFCGAQQCVAIPIKPATPE